VYRTDTALNSTEIALHHIQSRHNTHFAAILQSQEVLSFLVGRRLVTDNFQGVQNLSRYWSSSGYLDTSVPQGTVSPGCLEELFIVSKYRESPVFQEGLYITSRSQVNTNYLEMKYNTLRQQVPVP